MVVKLVQSWKTAGSVAFAGATTSGLPLPDLDEDDDRNLAYDDPEAIIRREHKAEKEHRLEHEAITDQRQEQRRVAEESEQDAEERRMRDWLNSEPYRRAMQDLTDNMADARQAATRARDRAIEDQQRRAATLEKARQNALVVNGGRVYFTRDGSRLYDEDDQQITDRDRIAAAQDQHARQPQATSHEDYIVSRDAHDQTAVHIGELDKTLGRLDTLDKRIKKGNLSPEELAQARADQQEIVGTMPEDARKEYARLREVRKDGRSLAYSAADPAFTAAPDLNADFRRAGQGIATPAATTPEPSNPPPAENRTPLYKAAPEF